MASTKSKMRLAMAPATHMMLCRSETAMPAYEAAMSIDDDDDDDEEEEEENNDEGGDDGWMLKSSE